MKIKFLPLLLLVAILCIILSAPVFAQPVVKKDTSFTVYSTYVKEKKKFPKIEIPSYEVPEGVTVKKDIVYCTIGERKLLVDVYAPSKKIKKGYPAVLLIYGGGWKSGDKDHWVPFAQQLAAKGYVAFAAEYRLSPEAKYPAAVIDLKAAVRWIRANAKIYNVDKKCIASLGVSAGGQLAALLGTTNGDMKFETGDCHRKQSSKVQAIVNIDGTLAFRHPESSEGVVAGEWLGGSYNENPVNWEDAAPLNHVDKNTPPIIFINSSIPRFHAGRTDMIRKLDSLNIYSEVHEFPDTPHPFWFFHPWFNDVIKYTVNFLDKTF